MKKIKNIVASVVVILTFAACGGGGGGGAGGAGDGNAGTLTKSYTLSLQGNFTAGAVKGIQFDLVLPAGITVNTNNSDSAVLASSLTLSGSASSGAMLVARFASGNLTTGIITTQGLSSGAFATLICNIPDGTAVPVVSAFTVKNVNIIDGNGMPIPGSTVTVN